VREISAGAQQGTKPDPKPFASLKACGIFGFIGFAKALEWFWAGYLER